MKTFARMPDECAARVAHLNKLFHPELVAAGVTFDLLSVATDGEGPALTHQGYAAAAVVRSTDVKQRTKGAADVEIVFDEAAYLEMSDAQRDALVDHELEHVELKLDAKSGRIKLDCRGRPKLGMRKHDFQAGWFVSIAERHGEASGEIQKARQLFAIGEQAFFPFACINSDQRPALPSGEPVPAKALGAARTFTKKMVDMAKKDGTSMTITHEGKGVKIDAEGVHPVDDAKPGASE